MTTYRASHPSRARHTTTKKKTTNRKRWSQTSEKAKTTWADPTVPISKISRSKSPKRKVPQLSCWWFG